MTDADSSMRKLISSAVRLQVEPGFLSRSESSREINPSAF